MMDKLQIRKIRMYNAHWYSIKFAGAAKPFAAMTNYLKSHGRQGAYWRQGEFGGSGGAWIVRKDILEQVADKFENFENRIAIARGTYERKDA
jgi:hypothetical protein